MTAIEKVRAAAIVARANARFGERPDRLLYALWTMRRYGVSVTGGVAAAVARTPARTALIDESGSVTYAELWDHAHGLASALADHDIGPHSRVGILCGNGRLFVQSVLAASLLGSTTVLFNTKFAGPQITEVAASEGIDAIVCDDELRELADHARVGAVFGGSECASMATARLGERLSSRASPARLVLLTSGTTGHARGASRPAGGELEGCAAILGRIPLRHGDTRVIAAPLFHGWGLTHLLIGLTMSATVVLQDRFEPEATLRAVAANEARVVVLVPVMLQRILELPPDVLASFDASSLRVVVCSGSAIPSRVATMALRRFGPVLYNVYGSTEVAVATIATPADLAERPNSAGRPAPGSVVRILDEDDRPVPRGSRGRIFVRNALQFDGYTTGGGRAIVDGLMSSGDVGSFDHKGRLVIAGREDDMIVSGGENVYPREVEEVLAGHPDVAEVVVVGVPDERFGQALKAYVVGRSGTTPEPDAIKQYVRERLARFQVPREIVVLEELPRNAMGKVLRKRLM